MDILLTRTGENAAIVWEMRLPRLIAAMLLGGAELRHLPRLSHGTDEEGLCPPAALHGHHRRANYADPGEQAADLRRLRRQVSCGRASRPGLQPGDYGPNRAR